MSCIFVPSLKPLTEIPESQCCIVRSEPLYTWEDPTEIRDLSGGSIPLILNPGMVVRLSKVTLAPTLTFLGFEVQTYPMAPGEYYAWDAQIQERYKGHTRKRMVPLRLFRAEDIAREDLGHFLIAQARRERHLAPRGKRATTEQE